VWTSGGTEAGHLAVLGTARAAERRGERRRHVIAGAVEHSSILRACERLRDEHGYDLDVVPVDRAGLVDPADVAKVVRDDTLAVHLQHANHEVGAIQPTHEVAAVCHRHGTLLHVDACQTVGQLGKAKGLRVVGIAGIAFSLTMWRGPEVARGLLMAGLVVLGAAELVSLVPGTLVVEARRSTSTLYVHVLDSGGRDDPGRRQELENGIEKF
jgi:cysteine desulfurase